MAVVPDVLRGRADRSLARIGLELALAHGDVHGSRGLGRHRHEHPGVAGQDARLNELLRLV